MKYPKLVPSWVCTTPISLSIEHEGINEDGSPSSTSVEGLCNWEDGGKAIYTADQKVIDISGTAYFDGDIIPSLTNIVSGYAEVFGETREIAQGFKRRNPDGTVNYTEIRFK